MFNADVFYAPLGDASLSPLISNPDADCGKRERESEKKRERGGGKTPCKRNFYAYVNAGRNLSGLVTNLRRKQKLLPLSHCSPFGRYYYFITLPFYTWHYYTMH